MGAVAGIVGAVVAAGGAAYAANQQAKASKAAAAGLGNQQQLKLNTIPYPQLANINQLASDATGQNLNNLPNAQRLANQTNAFNTRQAIRDYSLIQPYFQQLEAQAGKNISSYEKGELPPDVVASIGRAAAQRGIEGGFGLGANAGGAGGALGSLNLRNLGLTSLQLSQQGTQMAMDATRNAGALAPNLFDVANSFVNPNLMLQGELGNANILNNWNAQNTSIMNEQAGANTQQANQIAYDQTQLQLQSQLAQAQAVQGAANSAAGIAAKYAGTQGSANSANLSNAGFFNSPQAAQSAAGYGGTATNTPYGYAVRPTIIG
jgi:hypothetical protein